jgi:hypothetical protein
MLLCRIPIFIGTNQPEPRAAKPTSTSFAHALASVRFANAPSTTQVNLFCLLSPEAYLLTEKEKIFLYKRGLSF